MSCEIAGRGAEITDEVNTLYIGGGTPSVLPLSVFRNILSVLESTGHRGPYDEFTVEVNPEDIVEKGPDYVEGLLGLGVNRISMGVQSFDDGILKWMNRRHDSATARRAYSILEDVGVDNISIDLIFGMPQLTESMWRDTLSKALDISSQGVLPHHISSYQLSVEPGSALAGHVARGIWSEATDDLCAGQYAVMCEMLAEAGYHHYEISNFAVPGYEARHNSAYWRHVPYSGFGPGAHSYICPAGETGKSPCRSWNIPDLGRYLSAASTGSFDSVRESEILDEEQLALEHIMLALRTSEGAPSSYLYEHCDSSSLSAAVECGNLILLDSGNMRIPEERFFVSDSIISDIV